MRLTIISAFSWLTANASAQAFEPGGSNFVAYSIDLSTFALENPWLVPDRATPGMPNNGQWRPVIGAYDDLIVPQRLYDMCLNGQRKVALTVWFEPADWIDSDWGGYTGLIHNSHGGHLSTTAQAYLRKLVTTITTMATAGANGYCFNELQFRFARWGSAFPSDLTAGSPLHDSSWAVLEENWAFIEHTRGIIESEVSRASGQVNRQSPLKRFYDLDAEQAGVHTNCGTVDAAGNPEPPNAYTTYGREIWWRYWTKYGTTDTYGFSMAVGPVGRVQQALCIYDSVGRRPPQHALDVYRGADLAVALADLEAFGETNKPIIIQETFYNNAIAGLNSCEDSRPMRLFQMASAAGFSIRTIMQWPRDWGHALGISRADTPAYSNNLYQASYANSAPVPTISASGLGCDGNSCGWVTGVNFSCNCYVDIYSSNWQFLGRSPSVSCRDHEVDFAIPAAIRAAHAGIRVAVVNAFNRWNSPIYMSTH